MLSRGWADCISMRLFTRASILPTTDIEHVPQSVAQKVECEDCERERKPREHDKPPIARHCLRCPLRDHDAPLCGGRPNSKPDERQAGRVKDRPAEIDRELNHQVG